MVDTWVDVPDGSPFPIDNLPYGVFSRDGAPGRRIGVAIGESVLDLSGVLDPDVFAQPSLNRFMSLGRAMWNETRGRVTALLTDARGRDRVRTHLVPAAEVALHMPVDIGDYADFYSSRHHAENVGRIFRPGGDPLTPNWRWLPIAYHGRSGTIVVSGAVIPRPTGQQRAAGETEPTVGPSARLDFEAEVGFVVGMPSERGQPLRTSEFEDHVFGVVILNDWSARDVQAWEYVPLGPFLGKSFATSVSPWVVPLAALDAARVPPPEQDPPVLPYLARADEWGLDLMLEVALNDQVISRPPFGDMYWTPDQQLAHMTVNGASVRCGDLFASGTVSGPGNAEQGSLIELTVDGTRPLRLADGSVRGYLEDGDTVTISGSAPGLGGRRIGLGSVTGTIAPCEPRD